MPFISINLNILKCHTKLSHSCCIFKFNFISARKITVFVISHFNFSRFNSAFVFDDIVDVINNWLLKQANLSSLLLSCRSAKIIWSVKDNANHQQWVMFKIVFYAWIIRIQQEDIVRIIKAFTNVIKFFLSNSRVAVDQLEFVLDYEVSSVFAKSLQEVLWFLVYL